ncbi:RecT family recombinase [Endozoicomonas sp. 4G]|uniref:RecT family recombinase n=1 Tax=Endozoicomonas sp. 4G TaxID=2872754 RepID=UPI002078FA90|nr:RecT family recombinase [Endozoicomonas sp. 4G]
MKQQNVLGDLDQLDRLERFANLMASGRCTIPKELQDNPGDCLAVALQAMAWQMNPFQVAQKSFVIKGKLGYEAQLVNAVITRHAPIQGRLEFKFSAGWDSILGRFRIVSGQHGDYPVPNWNQDNEIGLWCEVSATMKGEAEPRTTRVEMVQAYPRQSTQWATDPKQQLAYVTVKRWARLHCPDIILGIYTPDELQNREPIEKDITPKDRINARISEGQKPAARTDSDSPSAGVVIDPADGDPVPTPTVSNSPVHRAPQEITPKEDTHDTVDKGDDRLSRVRNILRDQKAVPVPEPTDQDREALAMALDRIKSCNTPDQLKQCGQDLEGVLHPDLADQVREAYKQRQVELKGQQ